MNPELEALLKRIEVAGGPVATSAKRLINSGSLFAVRIDYPDEDGAYRWCDPNYDDGDIWNSTYDATLVGALKADALTRGARNRTAVEPGRCRVWLYDKSKVGSSLGGAEHPDSEAIAWCVAWLRAYEKQEPA